MCLEWKALQAETPAVVSEEQVLLNEKHISSRFSG